MSDSVDLCTLIEQFGSEERCREYLEALRWTDGIECPRCASSKISKIAKRNQFDCDGCRYQFSVTAGTAFNNSHLPLWKWFLATYLLCESRKGMSANQIKRSLGVSYKTAWYLCHRIRSAMTESGISGRKHETTKHKDAIYADGLVSTNTIESAVSLLRNGIGSWHKVSAKHLPAYLDEMTFRFNNRNNPFLFRDTIMRLLEAPVLEYKKLTAA